MKPALCLGSLCTCRCGAWQWDARGWKYSRPYDTCAKELTWSA